MFLLFDKGTVPKISNKFGIEFGVKGEVKTFEGFLFFERGPGETEVKFFGLSPFDFILNQKLKELHISQRGALSLLETKVQALEESSEAKGFELVLKLMLKVHEITSSLP
jgi:hypothetical protein